MTGMLTKEQIEAIKADVMTLEAHGGLWVTAEDYSDALARAEKAEQELDALADRHARALLVGAEVRADRDRLAAQLAEAQEREVGLLALIRWAHNTLWELNPNNYDHDEVCRANDAAVEVILGLAPVIGETHGYSAEWWADRAALAPDPAVQALVAKAVAEAGVQTSKAMSESDFDCLILDALAEAMKAMRKFPQPNYVISKIAEEAGEVVKAAIHCAEGRETAENLRGEMKQLIAMLYRLWAEGDQVHGLPSVAATIRKGETEC